MSRKNACDSIKITFIVVSLPIKFYSYRSRRRKSTDEEQRWPRLTPAGASLVVFTTIAQQKCVQNSNEIAEVILNGPTWILRFKGFQVCSVVADRLHKENC